MRVFSFTRLRQPHTIFVLIVLVLLARSVLAFHDSWHANLADDHCQIAQLAQNTTSVLPVAVAVLVLSVVDAAVSESIFQFVPAVGFHQFLIRAPPVALR